MESRLRAATFDSCFYLLLMVLPFAAAADEPINNFEQTIQQEIGVLSSCEPERCPVFYVRMLGRDFPIPNRYELGKSGVPGFRRYISPTLATPKDRYISGEALIGNIVVGPLAECQQASHVWVLHPLGSIAGVEMIGLSSPDNPDKRFSYILIAGDEYAQIVDQNPQLVELLLNLSERRSKTLPASK